MAHLGSEGRLLVQSALKLGLRKFSVTLYSSNSRSLMYAAYLAVNYQEFMGKSHMVNVPWIFNSMWYFVKGLLDES